MALFSSNASYQKIAHLDASSAPHLVYNCILCLVGLTDRDHVLSIQFRVIVLYLIQSNHNCAIICNSVVTKSDPDFIMFALL